MVRENLRMIGVLAIVLLWLLAAQAVAVHLNQQDDDAAAALHDVDRLLNTWIDVPPEGLTRVERVRLIYSLLQSRKARGEMWDKNAKWNRADRRSINPKFRQLDGD